MNKTEKAALRWLVDNKGLKEADITKSKGTPDFLTPIGAYEVKKLYGNKIIFYSDQIEQLQRFPNVSILVFDGDSKLKREALFSEIDLEHGTLDDMVIIQTGNTTIQIEKELAARLRKMGTMDDNYSTVLKRLIENYKEETGPPVGGD